MYRQPLKFVALALVSLGAACTSSETVDNGLTGSSGAAGASPVAPFMPFVPGVLQPPVTEIPPVGSGAGGTAVAPTGSGGTAGAAVCGGAAGPAMPVPTPPPNPFPLDLSGTVTSQERAPRPISGGTLLVLHDGTAAVVSDPDNDRLYVVDLALRAVRVTVPLQPGDEPGRLIEDGAGMVHVALRSAGAVATLDPVSGGLLARDAACAAPRGLAYEASRDLIHVACAEGRLVSLRAKGGSVFRSVAVAPDLRDVMNLAGGGLMVSTFRSAEAFMLDVDGKATERRRPGPSMRTFSPMPSPMSAAVAWRTVPLADGSGAVMLHQRGVDGPISPTPGGYGGFGKGCGGIVESTVTVVAPGGDTQVAPGPALQMSTLAVDVALSPDGKTVAIASPGNAHTPLPQLQTVSLGSFMQQGNPCVGAGSPGNLPTGQVVAVAYSSSGTLLAQTREPAQLWVGDGSVAVKLSTDTLPDTGHLIFHANSGAGIACASCHPEGGEDGRVWNFACLGARRTQSLRGRLSETAPFHWDGDMNTFPKLVDEVFVGRMAGPKTTDVQNTALLHWIDRVPDLPILAPADPAAVERGKSLFNSDAVKCGSCHAGAHFTNNTTVDVGTGSKLQVPSLRGVSWRAPFLHDGRAATLTKRFDPALGGADQHGQTSQLEPADIADLTAYLESL